MSQTDPHVRPPQQDPAPDWGQSLSTGAAGIALLHIEYARAGIAGWDTAHQWVTAMTRRAVVAHPDSCGLYYGAPAVAFVLRVADHPGYATALSKLDDHIAALTRDRLHRARERIEHQRLPNLREFDLIGGLTGIALYLLHRRGGNDLLREVLAYLVRLTEPLTIDGQTLPGWWTGNGPDDQPSSHWPGGHANLGIAHGIAGPLVALATAMIRGVTVPGHRAAIERICAWLDQWRCGTGAQTWWPGLISATQYESRNVQQSCPPRPSWCYGTPGLVRAQQLSALALGEPERQRQAERTLAACLADDMQLAQLGDTSLCHGWAGLLQTTRRAAADAGAGSELAALLPRLHARWEQLLYRRPSSAHSGLLDGDAGIALTRLAVAAPAPPAPQWDACLLITP